LFDARGDRSDAACNEGRRRGLNEEQTAEGAVRCVNRSQNTGSSRKDHFDL